jgi:CubicO group peptidase (beta-lactamase class C family)
MRPTRISGANLCARARRAAVLVALPVLVPAAALGQAPDAPPPSAQQLAASIDAYLSAALRVSHFSGSVLVARSGQPIISKGYGMANHELDVPNTPQTVFQLASITKPFTAMAILMLEERGSLSVNDPICKHLADCPAAWQPITIRHLLTHTSGIPDIWNIPSEEYTPLRTQRLTRARIIELFRDKPLDFAPGEKGAYSGPGYFLLGIIIERASGRSYEEFLRENIFDPVGMTRTGYDHVDRLVKNRASGYVMRNDSLLNTQDVGRWNSFGSSGLYSTVEDLLRWEQALYTEKLLSRRTVDEMFTPAGGEVFPGIRFGYGWGTTTQHGRAAQLHSGTSPPGGVSNMIVRFPGDSITIVVLGNNFAAPAAPIANDLAAMVFGMPYELPREPIKLAAPILARYVGRYQLASSPVFRPNSVITITMENEKLMRQVNDGPKSELFARSETEFFLADIRVTFALDAQGQVTGLTWYGPRGVVTPAVRVR